MKVSTTSLSAKLSGPRKIQVRKYGPQHQMSLALLLHKVLHGSCAW